MILVPGVKKESNNYGVIWCPLLWVTEGSHSTRGMIVKAQSRRMAGAIPWDHLSSPAAPKGVTAAKPLAHCFLVFRMRTRRRLFAAKIVLLSTCISCSHGRFKKDRNRNPGVSFPFLLNPQNLELTCLSTSFFLQSCSHSKANIETKAIFI